VAVVALDRGRKAFGEIALDVVPDVVDRLRQALLGEEAHPVSGEPCEGVFRRALEVGVDLVLEGAMVDGVDLDRGPTVGAGESVDHVLQALLRHGVGKVAAKRHLAALGGDRGGGRRGAAAATGGDERGQAAIAGDLQQVAPRQVEAKRQLDVGTRQQDLLIPRITHTTPPLRPVAPPMIAGTRVSDRVGF